MSRDAAGNMVVIRSFPFGCTTDHVDAVISTSSYREAGNCGVVRRRADSFGPPDDVGARSDIQGILDGAVPILLLEMSAAEFTDRHVGSNDEAAGSRRARCEGNSLISTGYMREVAACVVSDGTIHLPKNSLSVGVNGDRMSRASVSGQDEIAILGGSVRGLGRYSFPRRSAKTTVMKAATASTATAYVSCLS
jgi:hypothetical protein